MALCIWNTGGQGTGLCPAEESGAQPRAHTVVLALSGPLAMPPHVRGEPTACGAGFLHTEPCRLSHMVLLALQRPPLGVWTDQGHSRSPVAAIPVVLRGVLERLWVPWQGNSPQVLAGFPRARQGQATASPGFPSSLAPLPMWPGRCVGHLESFRTGCLCKVISGHRARSRVC